MSRLTQDSAGNVIGKLLKFGVDKKLLDRKYINLDALENATFTLLRDVKEKSSWEEHQELVHKLIDIWFPSLSALVESSKCEFSHMFDTDLEIQTILVSEGYEEDINVEDGIENDNTA